MTDKPEPIEFSEHDLSEPVDLSEDDIRMIEEEVENGLSLQGGFREDDKALLKASQYVGVISLPDGPPVEIQPKLAGANLVTLLRYANGVDPTDLQRETELEEGHNFVDTLAALYLEELEEVMTQGLRREYVENEGSEKYLRGRLNVQRQLASRFANTEFECDYDEFTYDTVLNQTVLRATSLLASLTEDTEISGSLGEYESRLRRRVTSRDVSHEEADRIELTRLDDYYSRLLYMSKLVLKNIYIEDIVAGESASYSLLIGMNGVFERLVERTASESVDDTDGWTVEGQVQTDDLLRGRDPSINIRPDFVLRKDGEAVLVGDAKWKKEIENDDVYQLVAYQTAYEAPGVLVYPDNDGQLKNEYEVKNGHKLYMIELPTKKSTTDVGEFAKFNTSDFSDFLDRADIT